MTKTVYSGQIPGAREYQEDYAAIRDDAVEGGGRLLLICDGMGGHAAGDVASKTAARAFLDLYNEQGATDPEEWLPQALYAGNSSIADAVAQNDALKDMGTTLLACVIRGGIVTWISVGDSVLYHVRKSSVALWNDDHSMAPVLDQLAEDSQITKEEALHDSRRNSLRSALMGDDIPLIDLQSKDGALKPGDVLLAASDGILTLDGEEIAKLTGRHRSAGAKAIVDALLKAVEARNLPHQDNTTVAAYVHEQGKSGGFFRSLFGG